MRNREALVILPEYAPTVAEHESTREIVKKLETVDIGYKPIHPGMKPRDIMAAFNAAAGVVFGGGLDVNPRFYKQSQHSETKPDEKRDALEIEIFDLTLKKGLPILAICRGPQLINIALGGTLIQHLPEYTEEKHGRSVDDPKNMTIYHDIIIKPNTKTFELFPEGFIKGAPSKHHQAIGKLGKGLIASGYSPGGIIEAVELEDYPLMGSQAHPEYTKNMDAYFVDFSKAIGE